MRHVLLGLAFILIADIVYSDHITVQGDVSGNWSTDTVLVTGDLTIPDGETLLIFPGTLVEFHGSFVMNVKGAIIATGNDNDTIFFSTADTTGFHADTIPDGGWRGIRLDNIRASNEASVFYRCRFSFGKNVSDDLVIGNGGAIYVNDYDKVIIDECRFQDNFATFNGGAVYLDSADITIKNSVFINNRCGPSVAPWGYGGAIASDNSNPDIRWNVFEGNSSTGIGGGMSVRYKDCNIYSNVFSGNFSALGGGLGVLHIPETGHRINTNFFTDNIALYFGGGIATINASPVYINNTIAGNSATYGGGFYCKDSISPDFYNNIIWGNTANVGPQGYLFEAFSQADFYYCDVEGGPELFGGSGGGAAFTGDFENCLDEDPDFLGHGPFPYSIPVNSPCFNAGTPDTTGLMLPATDLEHNPRFELSAIDIGADEVYPYGVDEDKRLDGRVKIWPNPFSDHVFVEVETGDSEDILIEILDLQGRKLKEIFMELLPGGKQQFTINMSDLDASGLFFMRITLPNNMVTCKLVRDFSQRNTK